MEVLTLCNPYVSAPLESFLKMHHLCQKIVAITNVFGYTHLFLLCALDQHKKSEKKV